MADKVYSGTSYRPDVREVLFGREGGAGWKLDALSHVPDWSDDYGDAWEETLDQILPHLARFVDGNSVWTDTDTGQLVAFWEVIAGHVIPAGA